MRGSLAVWCDEASSQGLDSRPLIELHFNFWCDLPKHPDVLDVGILLTGPIYPETLRLYFPGQLLATQVQDLSEVLNDTKTLTAVFNAILSTTGASPDYDATDSEGQTVYSIFSIPHHFLSFNPVLENGAQIGTVLSFDSALLQKFSGKGKCYLRLRISLDGKLRELFAQSNLPGDGFFASTFYRTKIVEFRVNEKRNYGDGLRNAYGKIQSPRVEAIHFFLVTNIETELARSHANFVKMRRLEPGLWTKYLGGLGVDNPENMIIYHWRAKSTSTPRKYEESLIAFCSFRQPRENMLWFLAGAIFVGTIGNALEGLLTALFPQGNQAAIQLSILILLLLSTWGLFQAFKHQARRSF